eukprot:scaffold909_cov575-Prasinococcus_capsulatus_cf.AAC.16
MRLAAAQPEQAARPMVARGAGGVGKMYGCAEGQAAEDTTQGAQGRTLWNRGRAQTSLSLADSLAASAQRHWPTLCSVARAYVATPCTAVSAASSVVPGKYSPDTPEVQRGVQTARPPALATRARRPRTLSARRLQHSVPPPQRGLPTPILGPPA